MAETANDERRRHQRFSSVSFSAAEVCLLPCPPLYGEPAGGFLVDLSAGGVGLLLTELIPRDVLLRMTIRLPDDFVISSVVTVRHVKIQGTGFLHGIEFLNPAPEMVQRVDQMARDYLSCEDRIRDGATPVCQFGCSFYAVCTKKERHGACRGSVTVEFAPVAEADPFAEFRKKFRKAA